MSPALSSSAACEPNARAEPGRGRKGPMAAITTGKRVPVSPRRVGYLGAEAPVTGPGRPRSLDPQGLRHTASTQPMRTAPSALAAVVDGDCDAAVVPIENSVEGGVPATIDALTEHGRLQIIAEVLVPVRFVL